MAAGTADRGNYYHNSSASLWELVIKPRIPKGTSADYDADMCRDWILKAMQHRKCLHK